MRRLRLLFPWCAQSTGIAGVASELLDALAASATLRQEFAPEHWLTSAGSTMWRSYQHRALPRSLARLVHRFAGEPKWLRGMVAHRYLHTARPGDIAWLFPSVHASVYQAAKQRGCFVVKEIVNTALGAHRDALVRAHEGLAWQPRRLPPQADIDEEVAQLAHCDLLFSCSKFTTRTFVAAGADATRMVASSYGWAPADFRPRPRRSERPRFLFVGAGTARKGLPHLLRAWQRAGVAGTLVVVGDLDPEVAQHCGDLMARGNVEHHRFNHDLATHYGHADAFVLPSFEEGSPLVAYLAMAAGLPCLVSPEAGGLVVRDGIEGLHAEANDEAAWIDLLRRVAEDRPLREQLGAAGVQRSVDYTWDKVIARRCEAMRERLQPTAAATARGSGNAAAHVAHRS
jgi:glycosyltransferase involved in cell wall biosynthesis